MQFTLAVQLKTAQIVNVTNVVLQTYSLFLISLKLLFNTGEINNG